MNYAELLFPDFSLILCGYLICRFTALDRTAWDQAERLVYFFLFPVLLFHAIVRTPMDFGASSSFIVCGLSLGVISVALSYSLPHLPGLKPHVDARRHAAGAQVAFRFNSFIALALMERVAGPSALLLTAVLIGVCVPFFNIAAVWPMARQAQRGVMGELLRNPLILATASGLLCNALGWRLPEWAAPSVQRIGAASLALGLLCAGAGLQWRSLAHSKALSVALLGIRHVLTPLLAWAFARLFQLDPLQTTVLLAFSALPTASSAYVLTTRMGYDGAYVAGLVTLSTLMGLFSLPFALGLAG